MIYPLDAAVLVVFSAIVGLLAVWFSFRKRRSDKTVPPGPKGWPLLGNLFDIPQSSAWYTFTAWRKEYGNIVYLNVLGRPILILNTLETATDLFEGRFGIYSDRPDFPLANLIGHAWNFGFMPYGKEWRTLRRMFANRYTVSSSLPRFYDSHRQSASVFLNHVLKNPDDWFNHIRLRAGQLIMSVTYGINVESQDDPLIRTAEAVMSVTSIALSPSMWLVNPIAILLALPGWLGIKTALPGLQRWRSDLEELRRRPFSLCKSSFHQGTAKNSFVSSLLQELNPADGSKEEESIHDPAAVAYGGEPHSTENTVAGGQIFILTMMLFPEVQKRAQEEIDRVVGNERLPDFIDREKLPYITALMKEVLRWHPPAPTGIPHMLREDDTYKGYHLPKGAVVMGNIWAILHDPEMYPDPDSFNPERFIRRGVLDCTTNDPGRVAFGFGRRVCPGKLFSEDSLWIMIAQFLAVFTVEAHDPCSPPNVEFTGGGISLPLPFECVIRPRSKGAAELVECASRS
ncbi:cytochrome P450 [Neolentinus lepideus HHB14362 ss-1]|uniref:Cytochrome P450 n=1 Tax=Neolentinus lepideus HHB14362 ss-1 TaxID=1314782 RepID=A0A165Q4U3_9AGAM|nr:cytochrome P450 [Neolentinus lepideus HHB14362 ss-1]